MRDAQKPDHVSLNTLLSRLREGRYVIPDFQRAFEWKPWDIRDLMRSVFLDYYIGSLLLWKGKEDTFEALACEAVYGFDGKGEPTHIVLDGQQRLTAMYYAFVAPDVSAPSRSNRFLYFLRVDQFMEEAYDEAFEYDWTSRGLKLLDNQEEQYASHMFPLSVVGEPGWALPNWVQQYEQYWRDIAQRGPDEAKTKDAHRHAENARAFGEHIKSLTEQYQVAFIELDKDLPLDKVCDIFTKINSSGIRLDVFDLINALIRPKGLQLKHLWREAEPRLSFAETERMNVYVLQVMSILRQAYCSPKYLYYLLPGQERALRQEDGSLRKEVLVPTVGDFERRWTEAVDALEHAIKLLRHPQEFGAISPKYLPYVSILPAFAALQREVQDLPPGQRLDAQRKVRYWYWASVFTNRYSGSVESTAARDFLGVKVWFDDDGAEPDPIREFQSRFGSLDLRRETRRGSSVYNGIFNLLVMNGARDWNTGHVSQVDDLDDHHIVPQSWGREQDIGPEIDSILNRTPLSSDTNRNIINERLPNEYLPELMSANSEHQLRLTLESHLISPAAIDILLRDPFTPADFQSFIAERQRTISNAIEELLIKQRLMLEPSLRELDAHVERVELALRQHIAARLDDERSNLPPHVDQKLSARIETAVRKDPSLDQDAYHSLHASLEYADLRELQDAITSKATWSNFEPTFANKDLLMTRFNQMAELRNAIRHSRQADDVVRKEGEASLMWFDKILPKLN